MWDLWGVNLQNSTIRFAALVNPDFFAEDYQKYCSELLPAIEVTFKFQGTKAKHIL